MKSTQQQKSKKHSFGKDQTTRKSSLLFIQFGLVFALLLTYLAIESKTLVNNDGFGDIPTTPYDIFDEPIPDTTPEKPKQVEPKQKEEPEPVLENLKIEKNNANIIESVIGTTDPEVNEPVVINIDSIVEVIIPEKEVEDFFNVQEVPIFPGCKGTKAEMKQCFSKSVQKLVAKKFNGDLAQELGLSTGKKRISVQFTVDKKGNVSDVLVRAPHISLEKEARRVVNLLPEMTPGKQRGRAVGVKFTLPITFMVE